MMFLAHPGEIVAICQLDGTLKSWNSTLKMVNLMAPLNRGAVPSKLSLPHLGTLGQFDGTLKSWDRLYVLNIAMNIAMSQFDGTLKSWDRLYVLNIAMNIMS